MFLSCRKCEKKLKKIPHSIKRFSYLSDCSSGVVFGLDDEAIELRNEAQLSLCGLYPLEGLFQKLSLRRNNAVKTSVLMYFFTALFTYEFSIV